MNLHSLHTEDSIRKEAQLCSLVKDKNSHFLFFLAHDTLSFIPWSFLMQSLEEGSLTALKHERPIKAFSIWVKSSPIVSLPHKHQQKCKKSHSVAFYVFCKKKKKSLRVILLAFLWAWFIIWWSYNSAHIRRKPIKVFSFMWYQNSIISTHYFCIILLCGH